LTISTHLLFFQNFNPLFYPYPLFFIGRFFFEIYLKIKIPYGDRKEGHTDFDGQKYFLVNCYYAAIDVLLAELVRRKAVYDELLDWNHSNFCGIYRK